MAAMQRRGPLPTGPHSRVSSIFHPPLPQPYRELASKAAEAQRLALQLRKAGEERASKEVQDEVEELKKERSNLLGRLKRVRWWW